MIEPLMPMELGSPTTATAHTKPTQQQHHEYQHPRRLQHKDDVSVSSSPPDSPTSSPPRARRRSYSVDRTSVQLLARTSSLSSLGETTGSGSGSGSSSSRSGLRAKLGLMGVARRTLGIVLLLLTVFLWTVSNFLASVGGSYFPPSNPFICDGATKNTDSSGPLDSTSSPTIPTVNPSFSYMSTPPYLHSLSYPWW